jgi:YfiH family protein
VSEGRCTSLNVSYSVGDTRENVDENIRRISTAVGSQPADLFSAYQVHGRAVTIVEPDTVAEPRPRCDVLATSSPRRTLMLRYADCTPVLLADPKRRVVAAVHAGWRGSAVRAAGAAVEALVEVFGSRPADIVAGIGPAIGPCCYVVGQDVVDAFSDRPELISPNGFGTSRPPLRGSLAEPSITLVETERERAQRRGRNLDLPEGDQPALLDAERKWAHRSGRTLDLWEANRLALVEAGVPAEQIEVAGVCTQCESERFFSHRANGGQPAGRFAALIRLED